MLKNLWGNKRGEVFLRKNITIDEEIQTAYLRIFVDTGYELFLNGNLVAAVDEWCNTRDYEVKLFLKKGKNLIAVHGINHSGHRGVCVELAVNGRSIVSTDKTWKAASDERWGWTEIDYDDSGWYDAQEHDMSAAGELQWWTLPGSEPQRIIPTLQCSQFFKREIPKHCASPYWNAEPTSFVPDAKVTAVAGEEYAQFAASEHLPKIHKYSEVTHCTAEQTGESYVIAKTERYTGPSFLVDFGGETIGYFRMKLVSDKSVSFRLYYGETIDEALSEPSRDLLLNQMLREEYRVFAGEQEFQSRMRVAFRYVRVEFFDCDAVVTASDFAVKTTLYPVERRGYFKCSDERMNKLWLMGERTLRFCMQEYYLDAPKRDRFLWTGDMRMCGMINLYTFADKALFEYCIDELTKLQMPNGGISSSYGEGCSMLWDYVALYIIAIYDYYMYTGNKDFLLKYKDNMEKAAAYLTSLTNEEGVIDVPQNPLGRLWMVHLNASVGKDTYLNKLYLHCLNIIKFTADLAGDKAMADKYEVLVAKSKPSVEKVLSDDALTKAFDTTMHTIIQYEMAEDDLNRGNIERMMKRIERFWIPMLSYNGDCLYENCVTEGDMDRIDEPHGKPGYSSYCHAWTGGATVLLPMGVAGIRPVKPAFDEVDIKPQTDIFDSFTAVVPTPHGDIAVKLEHSTFTYHLPIGVKANITIGGNIIMAENDGTIEI